MKRRNFLKGAVTAAAVMAVPSVVRSCVEKESGKKGPVPGKPSREFRYGPDGKFRILQITDTHHIAGDPRSDRALENVRAMMKMEKPAAMMKDMKIIHIYIFIILYLVL